MLFYYYYILFYIIIIILIYILLLYIIINNNKITIIIYSRFLILMHADVNEKWGMTPTIVNTRQKTATQAQ